MEDLVNLRADLKDLLLSEKFATLATEGDAYPNTGLVVYFYSTEDEKLYFTILKDSILYSDIKSNPHVALAIDNAQSAAIDTYSAQSISLHGKAQELYDYKKELHIVNFLERYPELSKMLHDEKCTVVEVHIHKYIFASDMANTISFDHF